MNLPQFPGDRYTGSDSTFTPGLAVNINVYVLLNILLAMNIHLDMTIHVLLNKLLDMTI